MQELSENTLTVEDAAVELNVSTRTVYAYLKEGKLKAKKHGKRLHILKASIDRLKAPTFQFDPTKQVVLIRTDYDGLLVKLGQLEAEVRLVREENQRLLVDMRFRDQKKIPWWKRIFKPE